MDELIDCYKISVIPNNLEMHDAFVTQNKFNILMDFKSIVHKFNNEIAKTKIEQTIEPFNTTPFKHVNLYDADKEIEESKTVPPPKEV